jgi:uncharacterized protein YaeQ
VAIASTVYVFDIELADVDRGVYETLAIRAARHPSETIEYLLTRVIAYCLEYTEGLSFSKGLAEPDEPAVLVRDLTGTLRSWIEVGAPDADRLHRASKSADRVVVYTHRDPAMVKRQLAGKRIHRAETIALLAVDRELLAELAPLIDRRTKMGVSVTEQTLYITVGDASLTGAVVEHRLA